MAGAAALTFAHGYTAGYINAMTVSKSVPEKEGNPYVRTSIRTGECLSQMNRGQQVGIIDKYVADHPELWHYDIADLADIALSKACHTWGEFSMPVEARDPRHYGREK